ncbi:MAG: peptidoglycan recognition protein family protein [Candidatus Obscuribacterales bacterium]|nr:peptidoglycan recognition protein family protein [Candidatus Obscuribacterales bacterium]
MLPFAVTELGLLEGYQSQSKRVMSSIYRTLLTLLIAAGACSYLPVYAKKISPPPIVTPAEWGSNPHPIPDDKKQIPQWITIHHAGELWHYGEDPAEFVRRMQIWGQNRPKLEKPPRDTYWPDLPYHFLIAPDGRIFQGRPVTYEPESNTKYPLNGNIGVEMMGDFNVQRPSMEQLSACVALTAWLLQEHKIAVDKVRTHQDVAPGQTDCPGKDFYRYIKDGQFKLWVLRAKKGQKLNIVEGDALPDGPTKSINDPSTAKVPAPPAPLMPNSTPNLDLPKATPPTALQDSNSVTSPTSKP